MSMDRRDFFRYACMGAAMGALGMTRPARLNLETPKRQPRPEYKLGKVIYQNPLASEQDAADFRLEGPAKISFAEGRMRLQSLLPPPQGHFVYWCPRPFPDNVAISWDFWPIQEPGLCMFFFSATGLNGEDVFDPKLVRRTGIFQQYTEGDISTLHASYFRRTLPKGEKRLWVCNLRRDPGLHMVAQGPDPIPGVSQAIGPYRIQVVKMGPHVWFNIDELTPYRWTDDGATFGKVLGGGHIAFRQMAPLVAEYANLTVCQVEPA